MHHPIPSLWQSFKAFRACDVRLDGRDSRRGQFEMRAGTSGDAANLISVPHEILSNCPPNVTATNNQGAHATLAFPVFIARTP
jgi:hypothetical protein